MNPTDWITAIASAVSAAAVIVYTVVTVKLLRTTNTQASLTQESIKITKQLFEEQHQPRLDFSLVLSVRENITLDEEQPFEYYCIVRNLGEGDATNVKMHLIAGLELFKDELHSDRIVQKGGVAEFRRPLPVSSALARAWVKEQEEENCLTFEVMVTVQHPSGSSYTAPTWVEAQCSENFLLMLEGIAVN